MDEESEDALSLRDLPLHNNNNNNNNNNNTNRAEWLNRSPFREDHQSSDHPLYDQEAEEEHDFEFSSPEWSRSYTASVNTNQSAAQNIVFFGKIIPIKQPTNANNNLYLGNKKIISIEQPTNANNNLCLGNKKDTRSSRQPAQEEKVEIRSGSQANNLKRKNNMLMVGLMGARVPREMVLSDIKNRQSRRQSPPTLVPSGDCGSKKKGFFWGPLKVLSCGHPNNKGIHDHDFD